RHLLPVPTVMHSVAELKKLTVPQLKALCKEKHINGYSKLSKDAIIQKLTQSDQSEVAATSSLSSLTEISSVLKQSDSQSPLLANSTELNAFESNHSLGLLTLVIHPSIQDAASSREASSYSSICKFSETQKLVSSLRTQDPQPAGKKRKQLVTAEASDKKLKTSYPSLSGKEGTTTTPVISGGSRIPRHVPSDTFPPQQPMTSSVPSRSHNLPPVSIIPVQTTSLAYATNAGPSLPTKRFLPLVVNVKKIANIVQTHLSIPTAAPVKPETTFYLNFPVSGRPPQLIPISLPPSLSQRKRVSQYAILISFVPREDLQNCTLVSRMFRYAVYLSAYHRLCRDFPGQRLSHVVSSCSPLMSNMWPYLSYREQEMTTRKQYFRNSFLGRLYIDAVSEHLWTSPDHERQIVVALRFSLTRLFFDISIGGGRGWKEGQIVNAQPVVENEIWAITIRHTDGATESFHVLEATCEPLATTGISTIPVRADWSAYISRRAVESGSLLDHVSWTNHEEYNLGISRLWLKRVEGDGEVGAAKRDIAERYILACVVANSVSGRWMSSMQMAQESAGLIETVASRPQSNPKVNLFLPVHHHVESVHLTVGRRALHPALAVIQTPSREYYILRDNGMQVGCEEEGVPEVWRKVLGCDFKGCPAEARVTI
ncbi:unnamed protein product, partial [Mycena citricolor]